MRKALMLLATIIAAGSALAAAPTATARDNDCDRNKDDCVVVTPPKPTPTPTPTPPPVVKPVVVAPVPPPRQIMQAYGVAADWVCDPLFTPEGAGWPGTPVGGWGKSWAMWPNNGAGGFVCQRSIVPKGSIWVLAR